MNQDSKKRQLAIGLANGELRSLSTKDIAERLEMSPDTVTNYLAELGWDGVGCANDVRSNRPTKRGELYIGNGHLKVPKGGWRPNWGARDFALDLSMARSQLLQREREAREEIEEKIGKNGKISAERMG